MHTSFLGFPGYQRLLRVAAAALLLVSASTAVWFVWFDAWFSVSHTLGALQAMNNSAERLATKGDFEEAENLLRGSLTIQQRRLSFLDIGPSLPLELDTRAQLALVEFARKRPADAEQGFDELIGLAQAGLGAGVEERYVLGSMYSQHGELLIRTGKLDRAREQLSRAHDTFLQVLPKTDEYSRAVVESAIAFNAELMKRTGIMRAP